LKGRVTKALEKKKKGKNNPRKVLSRRRHKFRIRKKGKIALEYFEKGAKRAGGGKVDSKAMNEGRGKKGRRSLGKKKSKTELK